MAYKKPPTIFLYKTVLSLYISMQTLECLTHKAGTLLETATRPLEDKKFVHKRVFKLSQKFIYSIQISKNIKSYVNWKTVFCYSIFRLYFQTQKPFFQNISGILTCFYRHTYKIWKQTFTAELSTILCILQLLRIRWSFFHWPRFPQNCEIDIK